MAVVAFATTLAVVLWATAHAGTAPVVTRTVGEPDAIISLASHEWERLPEAARWAVRYPSARVILTQPSAVTIYNCHDCANRVHRLGLLGVSEDRVVTLGLIGPGTHAEAVAARAYVAQHETRRLLIVTSPYHTRRSLAVFNKVFAGSGVELGVAPATAASVAQPERWWRGGYDRAYVAYEWAAVLYYAWHYGVPAASIPPS